MNYTKLFFFILIFIISCTEKSNNIKYKKNFINYSNKGFALIYDDKLIENKFINKKINDRSLIILNKNLIKDSPVRITNLLNGKYLVAKVGKYSKYPLFYNSVISKRIAEELEIDSEEPYVEIQTININNSFIINKAKTFNEEKKVANKAPVENIVIQNIGKTSIISNKKNKKLLKTKNKFHYIIKIADLYFEDSAKMLINRLINEYSINNIKIIKLSKNSFRVYKGPFKNLDSLKKDYNNIIKLNFENIEIIKL